MNYYQLYLSMRFNYRAYRTPPVPLFGNQEDNLIVANMVMQGTLYGKDRFYRELKKRTGRNWME